MKPPTNQDTARNLPLAEGVIYIGHTANSKCASSAGAVCCRFRSHLKLSLYLVEFFFSSNEKQSVQKIPVLVDWSCINESQLTVNKRQQNNSKITC